MLRDVDCTQVPDYLKASFGCATDTYTPCAAQADQQTAPIDAQAYDLAKTWNPSGYYDPETLRAMVAKQQMLVQAAYQTLANAASSCANAPGCQSGDLLGSKKDDLDGVNAQALTYIAAVDSAEQSASAAVQTVYVIAPGVKTWILDSLNAVSAATHAASVVACQMPWWASALGALVAFGDALVAFCKSVLGVAVDVAKTAIATGKAIGQTVYEGIGITAWVISNLPVIAGVAVLAAVGWYGYKHRVAFKTHSSRPALGRARARRR